MMNWLREHTKQIMVVLVLVAMFSYVGGQALQNFVSPGPGSEKYARIFGHVVHGKDLIPAQRDNKILERIGLNRFLGPKPFPPLHLYMLTTEAEAAGIAASPDEIDALIQAVTGGAPETLYGGQDRTMMTPPFVREAIGHLISVMKNFDRIKGGYTPSEPEARHFARDTEEKARVKMVTLDAAKFIDYTETIPDAEIQAQFDKYKDVRKGNTPGEYGYQHPPRVRLQCIVADIGQVEKQTNVSPDEIKAHWKLNKAKYTVTEVIPASQPASQPESQPGDAASSQPTTKPKPPEPTKVTREKFYSEAAPEIERELRRKKAETNVEQVMRKAAQDLLRPWFDMQTDRKTGYKPVPEVVKSPDYMQTIRNQASAESGIALDYFEVGPLSKDEVKSHPALGQAAVAGSGQGLSLAEYAFHVPPLFEATLESDSSLRLQLFQTPDSPLVVADMGYAVENNRLVMKPGKRTKLVLFRVVEALPAQAPTGVAEAHDAVVADLRTERAYARMEPIAKQLYTVARKVGMSEALSMMESIRKKTGESVAAAPAPFARKTASGDVTTVAPIGQSDEFIKACFDMAADDWKPTVADAEATPETTAATTRPAAEPTPKVNVVGLPKLKKWVVVELLGVDAVTDDQYAQTLRKTAYTQLAQKRTTDAATKWFDLKNIEQRCGFEPLSKSAVEIPRGGVEGGEPEPMD